MTGAWRITVDGRESLFPEDTWAIRVDDRAVWALGIDGIVPDRRIPWSELSNIEYSEFGFRSG